MNRASISATAGAILFALAVGGCGPKVASVMAKDGQGATQTLPKVIAPPAFASQGERCAYVRSTYSKFSAAWRANPTPLMDGETEKSLYLGQIRRMLPRTPAGNGDFKAIKATLAPVIRERAGSTGGSSKCEDALQEADAAK